LNDFADYAKGELDQWYIHHKGDTYNKAWKPNRQFTTSEKSNPKTSVQLQGYNNLKVKPPKGLMCNFKDIPLKYRCAPLKFKCKKDRAWQ